MRVKQHTNKFFSYSWYQEQQEKLQDAIDSGVVEELQEYNETHNPLSPGYNPQLLIESNTTQENTESDTLKAKTSKNLLYVSIVGVAVILILVIIKKF